MDFALPTPSQAITTTQHCHPNPESAAPRSASAPKSDTQLFSRGKRAEQGERAPVDLIVARVATQVGHPHHSKRCTASDHLHEGVVACTLSA